ncbi:MAG: tRNA 2-thiouridine(34) synthase MnmA [Oscillospiraceae bacterium]|nr:tRNA 2-thiouridine(34) synthase MnmA [Oscillospiraceae bacterium]
MGNNRVLMAMSGGLDSTVAVSLLKEAGWEVTGVTFIMHDDFQDLESAEKAASSLNIDWFSYDCRSLFRQNVMDSFIDSYMLGDTPNPCIQCNKNVKMPTLCDLAIRGGFSKAATGHYIINRFDSESGLWRLRKARDLSKDQSYVLYMLDQRQLSMLLFPTGEYTKDEIRAKAIDLGLAAVDRPESQDICFIPDGDYHAFIHRQRGEVDRPGDFESADGKKLGRHRGLTAYTTGQRRGLGVSSDRRLYVLRKDSGRNVVVLGDNDELFSSELNAFDMCYVSGAIPTEPFEAEGKVRYSQHTSPCTVYPIEGDRARVVFKKAQRAITPGQSVVLYSGDELIGGGRIGV